MNKKEFINEIKTRLSILKKRRNRRYSKRI